MQAHAHDHAHLHRVVCRAVDLFNASCRTLLLVLAPCCLICLLSRLCSCCIETVCSRYSFIARKSLVRTQYWSVGPEREPSWKLDAGSQSVFLETLGRAAPMRSEKRSGRCRAHGTVCHCVTTSVTPDYHLFAAKFVLFSHNWMHRHKSRAQIHHCFWALALWTDSFPPLQKSLCK